MFSINYFILVVRVTTVASCGNLANSNVDSVCATWRKGSRHIWKLPYSTRCSLLPVISQCLPIFNELCRRSLNFARSCLPHDCPLVRFIAYYGIVHARNGSPIGQNVWYCFKRYNCTYNKFFFGSVNSIVSSFCSKSIGDSTFSTANLLSELICVRESVRCAVRTVAYWLRTKWAYDAINWTKKKICIGTIITFKTIQNIFPDGWTITSMNASI